DRVIAAVDKSVTESYSNNLLESFLRPYRLRDVVAERLENLVCTEIHVGAYFNPTPLGRFRRFRRGAMPFQMLAVRAWQAYRPQRQHALSSDRQIKRSNKKFSSQFRHHRWRYEINLTVLFQLNERCGGQPVLCMRTHEVLWPRFAHWHGFQEFPDADRFQVALIEPQAFQVGEGVRRRGLLFANFAYIRGSIPFTVGCHLECSFSRPPYGRHW